MSTTQQVQSYQPTVEQTKTNIAFTPNISTQAPLAISVGNTLESPTRTEYQLIAHGTHLALWLVKTLDALKSQNPNAIYPIMSILEPYTGTDQELDLQMPPKSSRKVTITVTNRGRAKPHFS
jgi:hypothetical protein